MPIGEHADPLRYALEYVREHHLDGDECLCDAARSVVEAGLRLAEQQQAGAVAALVSIANTSPFDERWTHWREQAQKALAEMGVDPSTHRGQ